MLYNLFENRDFVSVFAVALLAEGVDRNLKEMAALNKAHESPSSRRAWIEMPPTHPAALSHRVALLAEGVDRNFTTLGMPVRVTVSPSSRRAWIEILFIQIRKERRCVALLAEGVDRNENWMATAGEQEWVALLAEGVDRNSMTTMSRNMTTCRPPRGGRG